jgi:hypothetical protein
VSLQIQRTTIGDFYAANTLIEPPAARYAAKHPGMTSAALGRRVAPARCWRNASEVRIRTHINYS